MREGIDALERRTQQFAIDVIRLCRDVARQPALVGIARQLSDAASSVSANHRAMRRARSTREFAAKLFTVHEEGDEATHWLAVIEATSLDHSLRPETARLRQEAQEIRSIFAKARRTTRERYSST